MIKITFEYANVDEAIVALAKLVGAPTSVSSVAKQGASPVAAAPQPSTRRGRSDKGQARGSYKNPPTVAAAPVVPEPVVSPTMGAAASTQLMSDSVTVPIVQPEPAAPPAVAATLTPSNLADAPVAAAAHTVKDLQEAIGKVFNTKGLPVALQVLSRFGANTYRDIKPEQYAEFIKHAVFVSEGGQV